MGLHMKKCVAFFCCFFAIQFFNTHYISAKENIEKRIALTFDDGPRPAVLSELLPLLASHHAPATFFVIGSVAEDNKEWLTAISKNGHEIENHSYGHENMRILAKEKGIDAVIKSILKTDAIISTSTGRSTIFFRPPYWEVSRDAIEYIRHAGFEVLMLEHPDINTLDYDDTAKKRSSSALIQRVMGLIERREKKHIFTHVLVFHELRLTVEALHEIIPLLKRKGYAFVRLDTLSCFPSCE